MIKLNSPTGKATKTRPLDAAIDNVKIEGGNTTPVDVLVTNLPADPAKDASLQAILTALVDQIFQALLTLKNQQTSGTQKTEVTNLLETQPVSSAAIDAMASVLGTTADAAFAGAPNGTVPEVLKGIFATLKGTLKTESLALPLPNGAATEVTMQSLLKAMQGAASSVWVDDSGTHYIQRQTTDAVTGVTTVSYTDALGNTVTPGAGLRPFDNGGGSGSSISFESYWTAKVAGIGYVTGQTLAMFSVFDTSTAPATKIMSAWVNLSTGETLTAPPVEADIEAQANNVTVANIVEIFATALPLPAGAATEDSLQAIVSALAALGAMGDVAWDGSGSGTQIAIIKAIYNAISVTRKTYSAAASEVTSTNSPLVIAAGATEISMANIGSANATIKSANMGSPVNLYPTQTGGLPVTWRVPDGGALPAVTITAPAGAVVQVSVIS